MRRFTKRSRIVSWRSLAAPATVPVVEHISARKHLHEIVIDAFFAKPLTMTATLFMSGLFKSLLMSVACRSEKAGDDLTGCPGERVTGLDCGFCL